VRAVIGLNGQIELESVRLWALGSNRCGQIEKFGGIDQSLRFRDFFFGKFEKSSEAVVRMPAKPPLRFNMIRTAYTTPT
jgi:hypothetical protein